MQRRNGATAQQAAQSSSLSEKICPCFQLSNSCWRTPARHTCTRANLCAATTATTAAMTKGSYRPRRAFGSRCRYVATMCKRCKAAAQCPAVCRRQKLSNGHVQNIELIASFLSFVEYFQRINQTNKNICTTILLKNACLQLLTGYVCVHCRQGEWYIRPTVATKLTI